MAPPVTWVLADDRPGNANQALGVAEALGWPFTVKALRYAHLARLPNLILGASCAGSSPAARAQLQPPWPDLVIAAGRRTAPIARWLRRQSPGLFAVQLMWPGSARGLDLVAVPEHDRAPDHTAVIRTFGAPHRLTTAGLAAAAAAITGQLAAIPLPRIACLVGGSTRKRPFTSADAERLAGSASDLARARGGG
jgi:mitochondrial fission protein ELM1